MKAVRINKYLMPLVVLVALLGSVFIAKAAGAWQTSGRGEVMLDENGQPDPEGIKGWMTLEGVSESYSIPLEALYILIGAPADLPADTEMKELEGLLPGAGVSTVREGVAAYLDGTWTPDDGPFGGAEEAEEKTPAPAPAATPTPEPTPEATHEPSGSGTGNEGDGFVLPTDGSRLPASEIRGRLTVEEVVTYCQVPLEYLVTELGLPADVDTKLLMRQLAGLYGIEVTAVRDVVQRYQDSH